MPYVPQGSRSNVPLVRPRGGSSHAPPRAGDASELSRAPLTPRRRRRAPAQMSVCALDCYCMGMVSIQSERATWRRFSLQPSTNPGGQVRKPDEARTTTASTRTWSFAMPCLNVLSWEAPCPQQQIQIQSSRQIQIRKQNKTRGKFDYAVFATNHILSTLSNLHYSARDDRAQR